MFVVINNKDSLWHGNVRLKRANLVEVASRKQQNSPMKQQFLLVMIAMISVLLFASSASAWNSPTHMVTGAIAYRILKMKARGPFR